MRLIDFILLYIAELYIIAQFLKDLMVLFTDF